MIKTLLIDLDGTLLDNDVNTFLPAYLRLLADYLSDVAAPERTIQELLAGIRAMIENNDPTLTLQSVFAGYFYPGLGVLESDLVDRLAIFYREIFPTLRALTRPVASALRLVEWAIDNRLEVVVATNPLFPRTAIEQRLEWAGLPVAEVPFALVASYERFHFCKPNVAYVAEILGLLGRASHEAVMIGNDPQEDLQPASELGMLAFHVLPEASLEDDAGSLDQAIAWIESQPTPSGTDPAPRPAVTLARMRAGLAAVTELTRDLPSSRWRARPEPASWAPVEIICHMRDVEREVNRPRYQALISQSGVFVPAADPDRWAAERGYIGQEGERAVAEFCRSRLENIHLLEAVEAAVWTRSALHAIFGPTNLAELASFADDHDTVHLDQLRRALAA